MRKRHNNSEIVTYLEPIRSEIVAQPITLNSQKRAGTSRKGGMCKFAHLWQKIKTRGAICLQMIKTTSGILT